MPYPRNRLGAFGDVSEQDYLDAIAKAHMEQQGIPLGLGPHTLLTTKGDDIALPPVADAPGEKRLSPEDAALLLTAMRSKRQSKKPRGHR